VAKSGYGYVRGPGPCRRPKQHVDAIQPVAQHGAVQRRAARAVLLDIAAQVEFESKI
jgi:hypothetical protein